MRRYRLAHKEELKKQARERYQDNKEAIKKAQRERRQNNKEVFLKRGREHYQNNKEELKKQAKKYYQGNKEAKKKYSKEYQRKIKVEKPWVFIFKGARERCNDPGNVSYKWYGGKGIKFKLAMDEVKTLYLRDGAKDMKRPSIDRIYNDGNYAFGNCRFIELSENIARSNRNRNLRKAL